MELFYVSPKHSSALRKGLYSTTVDIDEQSSTTSLDSAWSHDYELDIARNESSLHGFVSESEEVNVDQLSSLALQLCDEYAAMHRQTLQERHRIKLSQVDQDLKFSSWRLQFVSPETTRFFWFKLVSQFE